MRSPRREAWLVVLILSALLSLVGCGGSGAPSAAKTTPGVKTATSAQDQRHAKAIVLKLRDFPTSWRAESATKQEGDGNAADCIRRDLSKLTVTGRAESKSFVTGGATYATSFAAVFEAPRQANTAYSVLASRDLAQCFSDYLKKQSDAKVKVADVSWGELKFPHYAERSAAYRIAITLEAGGVSPTAYVDLIPLALERSVSVLVFMDILSPFDEQQKEHLAGVVARRM